MRYRWVLFFIVTIGAGLWAFGTARDLANIRATELEEVVRGLSDENLRLRDEIAGLQSFARDANARLASPDRFEAGGSASANEQSILDLVHARVGEGIPIERLAEVIARATDGRACEVGAETAEFTVRTELSDSDFNSASLADNRIVVTAAGAASRDRTGLAHAWFDPSLPVRVEFTHISGTTSTASGILPFQHALIADDLEYRFLLTSGDTSFISITADRCIFP